MLLIDISPSTKHNIILGKQWATATNVLLDCSNNRLVWPEDTQAYSVIHESIIPRDLLEQDQEINPKH